jgi:hypothetical protein
MTLKHKHTHIWVHHFILPFPRLPYRHDSHTPLQNTRGTGPAAASPSWTCHAVNLTTKEHESPASSGRRTTRKGSLFIAGTIQDCPMRNEVIGSRLCSRMLYQLAQEEISRTCDK